MAVLSWFSLHHMHNAGNVNKIHMQIHVSKDVIQKTL